MNRKAVLISMLAVFLAGAALGLMSGILFTHHFRGPEFRPGRFAWLGHSPAGGLRWGGGPGPEGGPRGPGGPEHDPLAEAMPRLIYTLELTPEQVARIQPGVLESRKQFAAARESLHARIQAELTPEQRARWDEMRRHMPFPGDNRGGRRRMNRALPGNEGEPR